MGVQQQMTAKRQAGETSADDDDVVLLLDFSAHTNCKLDKTSASNLRLSFEKMSLRARGYVRGV